MVACCARPACTIQPRHISLAHELKLATLTYTYKYRMGSKTVFAYQPTLVDRVALAYLLHPELHHQASKTEMFGRFLGYLAPWPSGRPWPGRLFVRWYIGTVKLWSERLPMAFNREGVKARHAEMLRALTIQYGQSNLAYEFSIQ